MPSSYTSNFLSTFYLISFLVFSSNQKEPTPTVIIYRHAFLRITLPLKPTLQRTSNHLVRTSCTSVRPWVLWALKRREVCAKMIIKRKTAFRGKSGLLLASDSRSMLTLPLSVLALRDIILSSMTPNLMDPREHSMSSTGFSLCLKTLTFFLGHW